MPAVGTAPERAAAAAGSELVAVELVFRGGTRVEVYVPAFVRAAVAARLERRYGRAPTARELGIALFRLGPRWLGALVADRA